MKTFFEITAILAAASSIEKMKMEISRELEISLENGDIAVTAVSEAFGFGCMAVPMAIATKTRLVALSLKDNEEEFTKEVDLIYNNLKGIADWYNYPIEKATWDDQASLLKKAWVPVEEFKRMTLPVSLWSNWANVIHANFLRKKFVKWQSIHPLLAEMAQDNKILAVNLQKWLSHSTEVEAQKQSLEASACEPIALLEYTIKVFTSHFHKVNDLGKVEETRDCLGGMYVPGETEAKHLFGVRGIKHAEYIPLVFAVDATVTIASTWQWLVQIINPAVAMKIFCNASLPDAYHAEYIQPAMEALGYNHQYTLFNESDTDSAVIAEEVKAFLAENKMD